jgi:DNA-binding response OmpR family regulator
MSGSGILIAEDDAVLREVYVKKLALAGFVVRTAQNGWEAIEAVEREHPRLLILDLNMPEGDGFAVLRRYPWTERSFPIIVVTNFGDAENRERVEELGVEGFFVKSEMTIKSLVKMVDGLTRGA